MNKQLQLKLPIKKIKIKTRDVLFININQIFEERMTTSLHHIYRPDTTWSSISRRTTTALVSTIEKRKYRIFFVSIVKKGEHFLHESSLLSHLLTNQKTKKRKKKSISNSNKKRDHICEVKNENMKGTPSSQKLTNNAISTHLQTFSD